MKNESTMKPDFRRTIRRNAVLLVLLFGTTYTVVPSAWSAALTGSIYLAATPSGQPGASGNAWDTRPEGGLLNMLIAAPSSNGLVFLNGLDNAHASIAVLLRAGTNKFTFFPDPSVQVSFNYYALNLFLDGHILPDISVKGSIASPMFTTNAALTPAMDGTGVPASGRVEYYNGTETVTLTECSWNSANGPGTITLVVRPDVERLTISVSEVEIGWYSLTNAIYQVQYRSEFTSNIWTSVGSPIPGTGARLCLRQTVNAEEPKRFYSVIRLQQ